MLHLSAIYLPIYGMNNQIGLFSRVHPNTHSNTIVVRNGFAWAVRIAREDDALSRATYPTMMSMYLVYGKYESPEILGCPTNLSPPLDNWKPSSVPSA